MNSDVSQDRKTALAGFSLVSALQSATIFILLIDIVRLMRPSDFFWCIDYSELTDIHFLLLISWIFIVGMLASSSKKGSIPCVLWFPAIVIFLQTINSFQAKSLTFWFLSFCSLLIWLVWRLQYLAVKKCIILSWFFQALNYIIVFYFFLDSHFFYLTRSHLGIMHLWQLQFENIADLAGLKTNTIHELAVISLGYFVALNVVGFLIKPSADHSQRGLSLIPATIVALVCCYFQFDFFVESQPFENFLMMKMDFGSFPLPEPSRFTTREILAAKTQTRFPRISDIYRQGKFTWKDQQPRKNLVVLCVESLRADNFEKYMPKSVELAKKGIWLKNHYAPSNLTMTTLFGLYYGIFPIAYRTNFRKVGPPVFPRFLRDSGYQLHRVSSVWGDNLEIIYNDFEKIYFNAKSNYSSSEEVLAKVLTELDKPGLHLIDAHLNSTHFNYYYPPRYEIFKPVIPEDTDIFRLDPTPETVIAIQNRYRNAVTYLDEVLAHFFEEAQKRGLDKNTIFVIIGDHGESLGECGFLAHSTGPHISQFHVPGIVLAPNIEPRETLNYSWHLDFIPILAPLMGFECRGLIGADPFTASRSAILNRDDSLENRLILRHGNTMSIFDVNRNQYLQWIVTTTNEYTLDNAVYFLYDKKNSASLAERIQSDKNFALDFLSAKSVEP